MEEDAARLGASRPDDVSYDGLTILFGFAVPVLSLLYLYCRYKLCNDFKAIDEQVTYEEELEKARQRVRDLEMARQGSRRVQVDPSERSERASRTRVSTDRV